MIFVSFLCTSPDNYFQNLSSGSGSKGDCSLAHIKIMDVRAAITFQQIGRCLFFLFREPSLELKRWFLYCQTTDVYANPVLIVLCRPTFPSLKVTIWQHMHNWICHLSVGDFSYIEGYQLIFIFYFIISTGYKIGYLSNKTFLDKINFWNAL